jgi:hypothetical protein
LLKIKNWPVWNFQLHFDWCMHIFVHAWYYTEWRKQFFYVVGITLT